MAAEAIAVAPDGRNCLSTSTQVFSKSGRGFANVEARQDDILMSFADDMSGAATYELEIAFGESNP